MHDVSASTGLETVSQTPHKLPAECSAVLTLATVMLAWKNQ